MPDSMSHLHARFQAAVDSLGTAIFTAVYADMASDGLCDHTGSHEYRRVYEEWYREGRPLNLYSFIRRHASPPAVPPKKGGAK